MIGCSMISMKVGVIVRNRQAGVARRGDEIAQSAA
jgi:hypothetical protein